MYLARILKLLQRFPISWVRVSPSEMQLEAHFSNFCSGWGRRKFLPLSRPLSNFWRGEMAGEKTMTEIIHLLVLQCPVQLSPVKNGGYIPRTAGYIPKILIVLFPCGIPVESRSSPEAKISN